MLVGGRLDGSRRQICRSGTNLQNRIPALIGSNLYARFFFVCESRSTCLLEFRFSVQDRQRFVNLDRSIVLLASRCLSLSRPCLLSVNLSLPVNKDMLSLAQPTTVHGTELHGQLTHDSQRQRNRLFRIESSYLPSPSASRWYRTVIKAMMPAKTKEDAANCGFRFPRSVPL